VPLKEQQSGLGTSPAKRSRNTQQPTQQKVTEENPKATRVPTGALDLRSPHPHQIRQPQSRTNIPLEIEEDETEDAEGWPDRLPSSSIRYQTVQRPARPLPPGEYIINGRRVIVEAPYVIPKRRSIASTTNRARHETARQPQPAAHDDYEEEVEYRKRRGLFAGHRPHWLFTLGIGMLLMYAAWQGAMWLNNWWTIHLQDAAFGRPRTYQFDATVGHSDSPANPTHFILINLNRRVEIYEEPGGDPAKTIIYSGPTLYGENQDLIPILGRVTDLTANGKQDLIIYMQDQRLIFMNTGTKFVPATAAQLQAIHNLPPPPNT
jgi:hypothetical protein